MSDTNVSKVSKVSKVSQESQVSQVSQESQESRIPRRRTTGPTNLGIGALHTLNPYTSDMKTKSLELLAQYHALQNKLDQTRQQYHALQNKLKRTHERYNKLTSELDDARKEYTDLQQFILPMSKQRNALESHVRFLEKRENELNRNYSELIEKLARLELDVKIREQIITEFEQMVNEYANLPQQPKKAINNDSEQKPKQTMIDVNAIINDNEPKQSTKNDVNTITNQNKPKQSRMITIRSISVALVVSLIVGMAAAFIYLASIDFELPETNDTNDNDKSVGKSYKWLFIVWGVSTVLCFLILCFFIYKE